MKNLSNFQLYIMHEALTTQQEDGTFIKDSQEKEQDELIELIEQEAINRGYDDWTSFSDRHIYLFNETHRTYS